MLSLAIAIANGMAVLVGCDVMPQLLLGVDLSDRLTFDNFFPGKNNQVVASLTQMARGEDEPFVYLWGEPGSGRTHLLQASCHLAREQGMQAVYLPLSEFNTFGPEMLDDLDRLDLVVLDDVDCVAEMADWEEALFRCYEQIKSSHTRLIVSGSMPPRHLPMKLEDLISRLCWGLTFQLLTLSDDEKSRALQIRAHHRGVNLSDEVAQFLIRRASRHMNDLYDLLEQLQQASLREQRKITIQFVKAIVGI